MSSELHDAFKALEEAEDNLARFRRLRKSFDDWDERERLEREDTSAISIDDKRPTTSGDGN